MTRGVVRRRVGCDNSIDLFVSRSEELLSYDISKDDVAVASEPSKLLI
jgi:hypothetical protein